MRISDWSSDVCSSDLETAGLILAERRKQRRGVHGRRSIERVGDGGFALPLRIGKIAHRRGHGMPSQPLAIDEQRARAGGGAGPTALPIPKRRGDRKSVRVGKGGVSTCRSRWSQYH